jgi:flagellar hook-basal body complex protein FliE
MQFSIDSTSAISAANAVTTGAGNPLGAITKSNAPFSDLFSDAVGQVTQLEDEARITVDRMMTGSGVDIHQAMIATQKVSMAFELALAVRNKAVQAYQSVMGMQF